MRVMHAKAEYTWLGKLENELRSSAYTLKDILYLDRVEILTYVEEGQTEIFSEWITELTNGQAEISQGELLYLEEEK